MGAVAGTWRIATLILTAGGFMVFGCAAWAAAVSDWSLVGILGTACAALFSLAMVCYGEQRHAIRMNKRTFEINMPISSAARMQDLRTRMKCGSDAEVIGEALRLLEHVVDEIEAGRKVLLTKADLFEEDPA